MAVLCSDKKGETMTTETLERYGSRGTRRGSSNRHERTYIISGSDDEADILQATIDDTPATVTIEGFVWNRVNRSIDIIGNELWEATIEYEPPSQTPVENESRFAFETGGGTLHRLQSIANISRTAIAGETAPDFSGAIGVSESGIEGVDLVAPQYTFSETHWKAASFVTEPYKQTLFNLTGKVNDASFKGFAADEVLFLGASGSRTGTDLWEITYRFQASENATAIVIGSPPNQITVPSKKGWEYLWIRYREEEDTSAKIIVRRPLAAYVEQVYETGNFASLGI